jgi:hypothetical protein
MTNAHPHFSRFVASTRMTNHRLQPSVFVAPWQAAGREHKIGHRFARWCILNTGTLLRMAQRPRYRQSFGQPTGSRVTASTLHFSI